MTKLLVFGIIEIVLHLLNNGVIAIVIGVIQIVAVRRIVNGNSRYILCVSPSSTKTGTATFDVTANVYRSNGKTTTPVSCTISFKVVDGKALCR